MLLVNVNKYFLKTKITYINIDNMGRVKNIYKKAIKHKCPDLVK